MRNSLKMTVFSLGVCASLILLVGCADTIAPQSSGGNLTGSVWGLSTLIDKSLAQGSSISIIFTGGGKISGSAGCNRYSGTYTASGTNLKITSPLASTRMACEQTIMDQETAYLNALAEVKSYSISGDQLTLSNAAGQNILAYHAQSQDLSGTSWQVISYNNGKQAVVSVLNDTFVTLEFGADGALSGKGGCNTYSGTYKVTGDQIVVGPLISTKMACNSPAGVMDQETQYLSALQGAASYQIDGTGLDLRNKDGTLAVQAVTAPANSIQGILWQWVSVINQTTGETITVPDPSKYTITFKTDGTLEGIADCNNFAGSYSQENGFSIKLGAITQAYCGETSLDQQYLVLLNSLAAGGPDGAGGLALETAGGEQRMLFTNGGPASK